MDAARRELSISCRMNVIRWLDQEIWAYLCVDSSFEIWLGVGRLDLGAFGSRLGIGRVSWGVKLTIFGSGGDIWMQLDEVVQNMVS